MNTPHQHDASCKELFSLLSEYVDGDLPADTCATIEAHFADCAPCVEFIANFKKTIKLTKNWQADAPPEELTPEKRAALEQAWQQALQRRQ
jgi:anti-sigma factor RsiW